MAGSTAAPVIRATRGPDGLSSLAVEDRMAPQFCPGQPDDGGEPVPGILRRIPKVEEGVCHSSSVMMNPSVLDVQCKETLEALLRPKYYRIIQPWLAISMDGDKEILAQFGIMLQHSPPKFGLRSLLNAYNLSRTLATDVQGSLDVEQLREGKPSGPRCKCISSKSVTQNVHKSADDVYRAFALENRPLRSLPFAQILTPAALERIEEWQAASRDSTSWPNRAELERVLRNVWMFDSSMPTYAGLLREEPSYQRPSSASRRLNELSRVNRSLQSSIDYEADRNRHALLRKARSMAELNMPDTDPYSAEKFQRAKIVVAPHNKGGSAVLPTGGSIALTTTYSSSYLPRVRSKWHKGRAVMQTGRDVDHSSSRSSPREASGNSTKDRHRVLFECIGEAEKRREEIIIFGVNERALSSWVPQGSPCCAAAVIAAAVNCCVGQHNWAVEEAIGALRTIVEDRIAGLIERLHALGVPTGIRKLLEDRLEDGRKGKNEGIDKVVRQLVAEIRTNATEIDDAPRPTLTETSPNLGEVQAQAIVLNIPFEGANEPTAVEKVLRALAVKVNCLRELQRGRPSTAGVGDWAIETVLEAEGLLVQSILSEAARGRR
ncbi:hypothetical protein FOZ61_008075 [Perkinsus olseni]|uniref:Uncharacterized protein n=1 Tax=Perkinsus olseni TaxID=32597 RepID=A0A7J6L684_PEROL|nr:hypothetical protein FOZ61_008075 [Perkinsus olseni]